MSWIKVIGRNTNFAFVYFLYYNALIASFFSYISFNSKQVKKLICIADFSMEDAQLQ